MVDGKMVGSLGSGSNLKALNRCFAWSHVISWTVEEVWEATSLVSMLIDIWIHHWSYVIIHMIYVQRKGTSWDGQIYFHRTNLCFFVTLRAQPGSQKVRCTCPSVVWGTWFHVQKACSTLQNLPGSVRCYTSWFSGRMLWIFQCFRFRKDEDSFKKTTKLLLVHD